MTGTIKITDLANAGVLDGTERVPIVMAGATKQATTQQIANLASVPAATLRVGSTVISNGTDTRILYDNNGVLGEYALSGTGSVAMTNSPSFTTPALGTPSSVTLTNATGLPIAGISATGTPSISTFLRGDGSWAAAGVGSVTSVAQTFTGGLISVAGSPITSSGTLALTVAGTSGGIPYFSSSSTWASSGALAANALVIGGGAGVAPSTTTTGTGVVTALGVNVGTAGAFVVNGGALGTPSSGTLTSCTGLPISTGVSGLGTGVATALAVNVGSAGAFVTFNGALGTPSSGTLTNATGLPVGGISATGTPSSSTFLRGDGSWQTVSASPGGSTTQVQYNNAGAFAGDSGFTYSSTNKAITLGGATVTASAPVLDLSQTWNNSGVTFTGWKLNVTDTASASASLLIDLQVGGVSKSAIRKSGDIAGAAFYAGTFASAPNYFGTTTVILGSTTTLTWANSTATAGSADVILARDAANTLALRNSTNAQTFNWYFSYTDGSNFTRGALKTSSGVVEVAAESAGTGTANIDLKLTTKGTGVVQYGTHSAIAAETVTGYITIKDAGGTTRKLAVVS